METTDVYNLDAHGYALRIFGVISGGSGNYSFGAFEDELLKGTGLDAQTVLGHLSEMIRLGYVISKLSQRGTAGPYGHWYKLTPGVEIEMKVSKKEQ